MHGTFNGIHLRKITSGSINPTDRGTILSSFRVAERVPTLEAVLRLDIPRLLILSNETVQGTIVHYSANSHDGYPKGEFISISAAADHAVAVAKQILGLNAGPNVSGSTHLAGRGN